MEEENSGEGAPGTPVEVTDTNLDETLEGNTVVVVDCWAPWCGPCQMVGPIIEQLAGEFSGRALFGKLNVDEYPNAAMRFGIMSIPTILIFKNGTLVDQQVGALPKALLEGAVAKQL